MVICMRGRFLFFLFRIFLSVVGVALCYLSFRTLISTYEIETSSNYWETRAHWVQVWTYIKGLAYACVALIFCAHSYWLAAFVGYLLCFSIAFVGVIGGFAMVVLSPVLLLVFAFDPFDVFQPGKMGFLYIFYGIPTIAMFIPMIQFVAYRTDHFG